MNIEVIILRLIHVLGGMFWVGAALFNSFFLMPAAAAAGPAAGPVLAGLQQRKLFTVLPVVAVLTILSGIRLIWIVSGNNGAYFQTSMGRTLSLGGLFAIVAFIFGMIYVRPAGARMGTVSAALGAARDDATRAQLAAELAGLRRRMAVGNLIATTLLILAAVAMAIARHLP